MEESNNSINERKISIREELIWDFIPKKKTSDEKKYHYNYTIPKFQRDFVWDDKEIKKLWDSIYRNYPIGSFMIWESDKELPDNREIADNIKFLRTDYNTYKYILDGQQRITSLIVSILGGEKVPKGRKRPKNLTIYFSLKEAEKEIKEKDLDEKKKISLFFTEKEVKKLSNKEEKKYIIKVSKLIDFDSKIYSEFYKEGEEEIASLYQEICNRLKTSYKLSIINLQNIPVEEVCELFTRVNVSGKKLSTIDLITANTFRNGFYLRDYLDELYGENGDLDKLNYSELDELLFIRLISIIKNNSCKESDLFNNLTSDDFKENWNKASDSFKESIKFLRKMNITSPKIFPYSPMIVSLSYFFYLLRKHPINDEIKNSIEKWLWIKSLNGDYQGATNEEIKNDCILFRKFINKEGDFKFNLNINLEETVPNEKLNLSSGFCKTLLCVMANMYPKDFTNHKEVDVYDLLIKYKKSELHHIFPKKSKSIEGYSDDEINSIINICFLPKESNQNVSNANPKDYFKGKVKDINDYYEEDLKSNLIPYDKDSGIWNDDFQKFLKNRAELIIKRINEIIK